MHREDFGSGAFTRFSSDTCGISSLPAPEQLVERLFRSVKTAQHGNAASHDIHPCPRKNQPLIRIPVAAIQLPGNRREPRRITSAPRALEVVLQIDRLEVTATLDPAELLR